MLPKMLLRCPRNVATRMWLHSMVIVDDPWVPMVHDFPCYVMCNVEDSTCSVSKGYERDNV